MRTMPTKEAPFQRLMRSYRIDDETGCWEWTGGFMSSGYGRIKVFGKWMGAHQLSYSLHNGHLVDGLEVMHSCDNKRCVNPDHLELGTHERNMKDARDRIAFKTPVISAEARKRTKQAKPVIVLGKTYESMNEAERSLGLGSGTVGYWIKNASHKARFLTPSNINQYQGA